MTADELVSALPDGGGIRDRMRTHTDRGNTMPLDLAAVMPVYNEEACIAQVVASWRDMLDTLGITYRIIVLNDGSKDNTAQVLGVFAADTRIQVVNKPNAGHGPTILQGYRMGVECATWVFQCDSDDELKPKHFPDLWKDHEQYDALFGIRTHRQQHPSRQVISAVSRLAVRLFFGAGIRDVNVPYRLMRAGILRQIVTQIPADTFAPNVIISGALNKARAHIFEIPVEHENRKTGSVSIAKWKLLKAAMRSLVQTVRCRPKVNRA